MKSMWRKFLTNWKESEYGRTLSNIPKDVFPKRLKQLIDALYAEKSINTMSGFKKAGIYPLNKDKVLERLPQKGVDTSFVSDIFTEHISKKRRKKLTAPPRKSIGCGDLLMEEEMSSPSTSAGAKVLAKKKERVLESDSDHMSLHEYSDT